MFKNPKDAERREPPAILRYGLAVLSVAAAIMATELTGVRLGVVAPAVCAVLLTAWYGGMGPGLLAWALSVLAIAFFFAPPILEFRVEPLSVPTFILTSLTVLLATWISAKQRSSAISLRQTRDVLDEKVQDLATTEYRFRNIFETAGVSIWEADFTEVERVIEELRRTGVRDFAAYFAAHPEIVKQAVSLVKIVNVNEATVKLFEAANKEQLLAAFPTLFTPETLDAFTEQLIVIAERRTFFGADMRCRTVKGHELSVLVTMTLPPRPGKLDSVLSTVTDITERKRAEEALRESERSARSAIDGIQGLVAIVTPNGEIETVNRQCIEYFGRSPEEQKDWVTTNMVHPEDLPHMLENFGRAIASEIPYRFEQRLRRFDGEYRWFDTRGGAVRDDTGRIVRWYVLLTDIEERKQAEERLRRSEAYLAEAQRLGHSGVAAYNETTILYGSEEIFRIWGFDPAQGVPSRDAVFQRIHPDDRDRLNAEVQRAVGEKRGYSIGYRIALPDGTVKHLETIGQPVFSASGELVEIVTTQIDVTERKCAEQALRESEGKIRRLVDANIIGIFIWDFDGRILEANEAFLDIVGYDHEDLVAGRIRWTDLTPPEWRDRDTRLIQEQKETGTLQPFEKEYFRKDGSRLPVLIGVATFEESGNQGVAFVLDLTERKCAEQALRESEAKLRDYAETASDWFWEIGPDYKFTMLTENAFGSNPADRIGTACWDRALDLETEREKWRVLRATLDSQQPFRDFVYYTVGGNGLPMYVRASGKPVFDANGEFRGYRGTGTDVTSIIQAEAAAREAQAELARVSRMTTLGELAASIAHEINQPLGAIVTNAGAGLRWLNMETPNVDEVRETLARIQKDGNRAADVIGRVRALARKAPVQKDGLNINDVIADVIALTRGELDRSRVLLHIDLADGLPAVSGDKVQLQQVVLNLIVNAIEAMRESERRHLMIASQEDPEGHIRVSVRDSGGGLKPESIDQIFKSFFTTKSGGMGMGLSICRSIIEMHGGRLFAGTNAPHDGATFEFALPSQAHSFVAQPPPVARENPRQAIP